MTSHTEFCRWLVIDWTPIRDGWLESDETPERFLLVTRDGRRWMSGVPPLSLPKEEFVLIMFAYPRDPLTEEYFDVDDWASQPRRDVPIWCHYGGQISLERLADDWQGLDMFNETIRAMLTERLIAPQRYPMPISISGTQDLDWNSKWVEIKRRIVFYERDKWDELNTMLNEAWTMAINKFRLIAAKSTAEAWVDVAHVFGRLSKLLEFEGLKRERIARVLQEAKDSQLYLLRPQVGEDIDSSDLLARFEAVLAAIDAISVDVGQEESLKGALKQFKDSYQVAGGKDFPE